MTDKLTLLKWEAIRIRDESSKIFHNTDPKNVFGKAYELGQYHALDYIISLIEGDKTN